MKRFLAVIALLLLASSACFALSDSEYTRMKKNNADFAHADQRLSQVWKKLKSSLPKQAFSQLQELQRDWLEYGRDEEATKLINESYSRVEAYTMVTSDRAASLPDLAQNIVSRLKKK